MNPPNGEQDQQQQPQQPQVPKVDTPETRDDITALAALLAEYRAEVAAFREEVQKMQKPAAMVNRIAETEEERLRNRLAAIAEHDFYCPGCGFLAHYRQRCTGTDTLPHPPIEVVSTEELSGDPAQHTAAPAAAPPGVAVAA